MEIVGTVNKSGQTLDAAVSTGTRSLTGGVNSGIGAAGTVKYIPQTLTEEQKAQARENIGAAAPGESGGSENGATFTPTVSEDGVLSWTNDKELDNPEPVNIMGRAGNDGISITNIKIEEV